MSIEHEKYQPPKEPFETIEEVEDDILKWKKQAEDSYKKSVSGGRVVLSFTIIPIEKEGKTFYRGSAHLNLLGIGYSNQ